MMLRSVAVWLVLFSRLTMTSLCHSTRRDCLIVVSNVRNSDFFLISMAGDELKELSRRKY